MRLSPEISRGAHLFTLFLDLLARKSFPSLAAVTPAAVVFEFQACFQLARPNDYGNIRAMDVKHMDEVPAFVTKDGSEIRELLAYRNSVIRQQSLAEARLGPGVSTQEHYHAKTEEIYYITHGTGRMRIEDEVREVKVGDAVAIPPGKKHKLWNTGSETLRLLCCCAPCYEHSDTFLTE